MDIYKRGTRKEYEIIYDLRRKGFNIAQRTAGSHSKIDIIAINIRNRLILLIQSKRTMNKSMKFIDSKIKHKIEKENKSLNGFYKVMFEVR